MAEIRIKDIDEHEIDTILAEDIDFEGHVSFKKPLMIKGKFRGEIKASSSLYVGEKAYVEATIEANLVSSKGRIKGDILGHSRVELFSTAKVDGDITAPDFVAESGCKFNGYCNMSGGPAKKEHPQPQVQQHSQQQGQPQQHSPQAQQQAQPQPHQQPQGQQPQQQSQGQQPQQQKPQADAHGPSHQQAQTASPGGQNQSNPAQGSQAGHNPSHGGGAQK